MLDPEDDDGDYLLTYVILTGDKFEEYKHPYGEHNQSCTIIILVN